MKTKKLVQGAFPQDRLSYSQISLILESIYESEISCRIEWIFDGGFTWSIQDGKYPRLWKDDNIDNVNEILCENVENRLLRNNLILEKDWLARGNDYSLANSIQQLAEKVIELFPESKLAKWYRPSNRIRY